MSRKDRFAKAMFRRLDSMEDSEAAAALPIQEEPASAPDEPELPPDPPFSKRQPFTPPLPTTILAEGSVFEGTLTTKGNIDMACTFKGNIFSEGSITMRHELEGNVQAVNIDLSSCTVTGDLRASEGVRLDEAAHRALALPAGGGQGHLGAGQQLGIDRDGLLQGLHAAGVGQAEQVAHGQGNRGKGKVSPPGRPDGMGAPDPAPGT